MLEYNEANNIMYFAYNSRNSVILVFIKFSTITKISYLCAK